MQQQQKLFVQLRNADKQFTTHSSINDSDQVNVTKKSPERVNESLQKIQQKAAKLLLGSNNNNNLIPLSNHNVKQNMNQTQNFSSNFHKQSQNRKNKDIIDAFDENRQRIAHSQGLMNLTQKSKQMQNKLITQTNMFTIKSKREDQVSPGSRYAKNVTKDSFFPQTTKSVGFGATFNLNNKKMLNQTQTELNTARSNNTGDRVGITGFNLGKKMNINQFKQNKERLSVDAYSTNMQQMSRSYNNDDILMSIGDAPRKKNKNKKKNGFGGQISKVNQSQQYYPPISQKLPLSPMSNQLTSKNAMISPYSNHSQNLQNWQSSELPRFIKTQGSVNAFQQKTFNAGHGGTANHSGRNNLMQPKPSSRNVFSAEPHGVVDVQTSASPSQYQFENQARRPHLNKIAESSLVSSSQNMSHKFSTNNHSNVQNFAPVSRAKKQIFQNKNRVTPFVDSVQYLNSPEQSFQAVKSPKVNRTDAQIRRFMSKFDELTQESVLQNVFIKIWKMLLKTQYKQEFEENVQKSTSQFNSLGTIGKQVEDMKSKLRQAEISKDPTKKITFESNIPTIPLNLDIYEQCLPQFRKALGAMFDTDEFVAKSPDYINPHIFFDRFCYDMVSLLGNNVYKLNVLDIEYIFRTTYVTLSHSFGPSQGGVKLLQLSSIIESPFSIEALQELNSRLVFDSEADIQIKVSSPLQGIVGEMAAQKKISTHTRSPTSRSPKRTTNMEHTGKGFYHGQGQNTAQRLSPSLQRPSALKKFGTKDEARMQQKSPGDQAFGEVGDRRDSLNIQEEAVQTVKSKNDKKTKEAKNGDSSKRGTFRGATRESPGQTVQGGGDQIPHQSAHTNYREMETFNTGAESPRGRSTQRSPDHQMGGDSPTSITQSGKNSGMRSQVSIGQLVKQQQQEKADKQAVKQSKLMAIMEKEMQAQQFEPILEPTPQNTQSHLYSQAISEEEGSTLTECEPFRGPPRDQLQSDYHKLQSMKSKKRTTKDPLLNGSIQPLQKATDGSLYQQSLIGQTEEQDDGQLPQKRILAGNRRRRDEVPKIGRAMQLDILEDFKNYDEVVFKTGQQDNILNDGLAAKSLQPTEINLLQSSRIDRKTILLNHMQMFDRASCGIADKEGNQAKQQMIVRKLGTEHVNNLRQHTENIDEQQPSLDQYDQLNQTSQVGSTTGLVQIQKTNQGVETTKSLASQYGLPTHASHDSIDYKSNIKVLQSVASAQYNLGKRSSEIDKSVNRTTQSLAMTMTQDQRVNIPFPHNKDPMMINPMTQFGSQTDVHTNSSKVPPDIYVYIDEQGNFGEKVAKMQSRNITAQNNKTSQIQSNDMSFNQGIKTKYIVQLNSSGSINQDQLRDENNLKFEHQAQTINGTNSSAKKEQKQRQMAKEIGHPTQKMLTSNELSVQEMQPIHIKNPLSSTANEEGWPIKKLSSRSARLSNEQFDDAYDEISQSQSRGVILVDESQHGDEFVDNDDTNEDPSNNFIGSGSEVDQRLTTEQPKMKIQGPKMISIEFDSKNGILSQETGKKRDVAISTKNHANVSFISKKTGESRRSDFSPPSNIEAKANLMVMNKTNYHLMHKKNKQQRKITAKQKRDSANPSENLSCIVKGSPKNDSRGVSNTKDDFTRGDITHGSHFLVASQKVAINQVIKKQNIEIQGGDSPGQSPFFNGQQKKTSFLGNTQIMNVTPIKESCDSPMAKASVGIQNTSDLMRNGVDQSNLSSQLMQKGDLTSKESLIKKIASQGSNVKDSYQSSELQPLVSALTNEILPSRDLAAKFNQNSQHSEQVHNDDFNQLVSQAIESNPTNMSFDLQKQKPTQIGAETKLKFMEHSVLPLEIESKKIGKNIDLDYPSSMQQQEVSLQSYHFKNGTQNQLNSKKMDFKNMTYQFEGTNKDLPFRITKRDKEMRIRRKSPRVMHQSPPKVQDLQFGVQSRKLNANIEKGSLNSGNPISRERAKVNKNQNNSNPVTFENNQSFNEDLPYLKQPQIVSPSGNANKKNRVNSRQVVIPVANLSNSINGTIQETPFMRQSPNLNQNSVGNSINSGTSINEEESRGVSSFHIKKTQSITNQNKIRYQIIHKQSSQQKSKNGDAMLESIQTSKLLQSTIITGQIGEYDQMSRTPDKDDVTEHQDLARATALRQREESIDNASPLGNPLDALVSQGDRSSKESKVMSQFQQMVSDPDNPAITSGSRFVVENNPTEPTEYGENSVQVDLEKKHVIRAALNKKTSVSKTKSQNPANSSEATGKMANFQALNLRGPLQFNVIENTELDKIHSNRQAIKHSQIFHQKQKFLRRSGFIESSKDIVNSNASKDISQNSNKIIEKQVQNRQSFYEESKSFTGKTHQQIRIRELKIDAPDRVDLSFQDSLSSTPRTGVKRFPFANQKTESPANKIKRKQIKELNSKNSSQRQMHGEPVLMLRGQSPVKPEIEACPSVEEQSREGTKSKMHKVEVDFLQQLSSDQAAFAGRQATELEKQPESITTSRQDAVSRRPILKSFDSQKAKSPIVGFSQTQSDFNPSHSIFGQGQKPMTSSREDGVQQSQNSSAYVRNYNEYMQHLQDIQDSASPSPSPLKGEMAVGSNVLRGSPNFIVNPNVSSQPGVLSIKTGERGATNLVAQASTNEPNSARSNIFAPGSKHNPNCTRICCIQNAISNQIDLNQKKQNIKKMKAEQIQTNSKELINLESPSFASTGSPKKGNITPIAMVSFADHNLQPWRQTENNKANYKIKH